MSEAVTTYFIPVFTLGVLAEFIYARRTGKLRYENRDAVTSLAMGTGSVLVNAFTAAVIWRIGYSVWQHRVFDIGFVWWAWILCFIGEDFFYYWFHRSAHRVRWFWASHVVHHSSCHYNLSTALRQTWTGLISCSFIFHLPLFFIGLPPAMIFSCAGLNLVYQFWIHTEAIKRCPAWFEAVMNTPSHHRVHHATNPDYLDCNYAGVFIIWDKGFGSFVSEQTDVPCDYGLVHNINSFNPLVVASHEWLGIARDVFSSRSLGAVIGYSVGPPGWSHDGSRMTTAMLKARAHTGAVALDNRL